MLIGGHLPVAPADSVAASAAASVSLADQALISEWIDQTDDIQPCIITPIG